MRFDEAALLDTLTRLPEPSGWLVAFSGGLDSSVLLQAMARLEPQLGAPLRAVHIHHGLLPHADAWSDFCRDTCAWLGVPLEIICLDLEVPRGESLEAVAREARYDAIADLLGLDEMLLTAQHQDDQAETLLLQALRGGGIEGLAGMPRWRQWRRGWQARPLLDYARDELRAWANEQGLDWIEDPSNEDQRFDRNYLRHAVMPIVFDRWPGASRTLARSAGHLADSLGVLREVAQSDLERCRANGELRLDRLSELSAPRRAMAIRTWIRERGYTVPDQRRMHTIETQVMGAADDRSPCISWGNVSLRRYQDRLYLTPHPLPPVPAEALPWPDRRTLQLPPGCGELRLIEVAEGIPQYLWQDGRVQVCWPEEGMRCRLPGREGSRSLKKLCQERGLPPWIRPYLPLIHVDDRLVAIAGFGLCDESVPGGEPAVLPVWTPGF